MEEQTLKEIWIQFRAEKDAGLKLLFVTRILTKPTAVWIQFYEIYTSKFKLTLGNLMQQPV